MRAWPRRGRGSGERRRRRVRARGVPPCVGARRRRLPASRSLLFSLAIGPGSIGAGAIAESAVAHGCRCCTSTRRSEQSSSAIVWQLRAPRVVLAAHGRRHARDRRRRPTRASSATRSPTLTCSASPPGRGSARPSRSPTSAAAATSCCRSPRSAARSLGVAARLRARLDQSAACRGTGDADPRRGHRRRVHDGGADFVQQQHSQTLQSVYSWLLGGFDGADWHDVILDRALHRGQLGRAAAPPPCARRAQPRRRRGGEPRGRRAARARL